MSDPPHLLDKRARIHNLVDEFFEQVQTADQQNRATLIKKTLSADALFQSPISLLPGDEMEERHDHAKAIQKRVRSVDKRFSLTALDVAVILNVPLSQLRPNGNLSALPRIFYCYGERLKIWEYSRVIVNFARYTNRQFKNDSAKISTQASSKKSASVSSKKGSNKRPYTEDEKDDDYKPDDLGCALATIKAVRERDGYACVFTRTSNPEVAHIIPASWNVTSVQIKKTTRLMVAIETLMAEKNKADVRTFRDNGYPAPQLLSQDGIVAALNAINGVPLISGRVIRLRLPTEDVPKLQTVLDLQWACVNIATMAGSAGWPEFLPDPDDEEGDTAPMPVRQWVLEQSALAMQPPGPLPLQSTTNRPPRSSSPN
ncbi:hypothetical protein ACKAV7_007912 [Fusarium commune]